MLNNLHVENFKAWRQLDIKFGSVTGLFGTNSSGKSSLLQFLLLLKHTKDATDRGLVLDLGGPNDIVNLGSYKDLIHKHDVKESISYTLDWDLPKQLRISDPGGSRATTLFSGSRLTAKSRVSFEHNTVQSNYLGYEFDGTTFELLKDHDRSSQFRLLPDSTSSQDFQFIRNKGRVWKMPGPIKTHLFPDQAKTYYQNADFLSYFESEYEAQMDRIYYLGPLREYPKREYQWTGSSPMGVGNKGEKTIDAIMAATNKGELRNEKYKARLRPFQEMIAFWLKKMGLIEHFSIKEIAPGTNLYQAKVKRDANSAEALLTDVGFGVSQVLPALVLLYYVPEGATVLMEQPEIHLHPSVQSNLADVILTVAKARNLQVVVESHSEHLLRRFQRRVAENSASADDVKLYFCDSVDGESKLIDLQLNLFGDIENWPKNFFGDELGEIAAIKSAALKRKIQAQQE